MCDVNRKICGFSFVSIFDLLALLKIVECMPESILVYKKAKTRPSHHEFFYIRLYEPHMPCMDCVNDYDLGQPSHLTNYM